MAEMQQVLPLHNINRFPRKDDLDTQEEYAHTSYRIYKKAVGCSADPYTLLFYISYLSRRLMHPCGLLGYLV